MGERRNRKSLWNAEEETNRLSGMSERDSWVEKERHHRQPGGRYREFSASGTTSAPKSRSHSSWELMEENPVAPMSESFVRSRHNAPEGKEVGGENRYRNPYNGFDEMERHDYDQALENDRMNSYRYTGRGRSRSRSRSRTRGRSRSRSRGKERGGGSRSRSRSRSDARGRTRSRSPSAYRRESYGWSDRKGGPDKSSQICRNFAGGNCRRGSQCRFFHPDNTSQMVGDFVDGPNESWRERADHGRVARRAFSRDPGSEIRGDDVSGRHGEDERFSRKGRNAIPCKDFMKGNCRWGDSCKFSHQVGSDSSFGKSNRNSSFDEDIEFQASKNTKPLCKYFAAGNCSRDNCRFSHEDPKLIRVEDGRGTDNRRLDDKKKSWDGPTWDDSKIVSDTVKNTGWGEMHGTKAKSTVDRTVKHETHSGRTNHVEDGRSIDNRQLHDKIHNWEGPTWNDAATGPDSVKTTGWGETYATNPNSTVDNGEGDNRWAHSPDLPEWEGNNLLVSENRSSPPKEIGTHARDVHMAESVDKENTVNRQENLLLHHPQVQNPDGILNVQGRHPSLDDQTYSMNFLQQNVSTASSISLQPHRVSENNLINPFSGILHVDAGSMARPILSSEANSNQIGESMVSGHSSVSSEKVIGLDMLSAKSSDEFRLELNGPENHRVTPLNLHAMQNHGVAVQSPVPQFLPNLLTNSQPSQMSNPVSFTGHQVPNPSVVVGQRSANEQSQTFAGIAFSNSMPSISDDSGQAHFLTAVDAQTVPFTVSRNPFNPLKNNEDFSEPVNDSLAQGGEPISQINLKQSSPPIVPIELHNSNLESQKLKIEDVVAISETNGGSNAIGEGSKSVKESIKPSETLDTRGKAEEVGGANKDEKAMRMLKNALIELVKELLKPKWKEGRMSREVHKTIVKKVVDKVTSTITGDHIPKTQDKVMLYLSSSKPKISKLVQAYVERCMKTES